MKAICAILVICCSIAAIAQAKISVPEASYRSHDKIDVEILNTGSGDVTFCVEYGYISFIDYNSTETTPTPVYVQQKGARGWNTLLTGPDIGSAVHPITLGRGESKQYPFRVNAHGTVRLVLDYWVDSSDYECGDRKSARRAVSREFRIE